MKNAASERNAEQVSVLAKEAGMNYEHASESAQRVATLGQRLALGSRARTD
jgi:hypothetical protein